MALVLIGVAGALLLCLRHAGATAAAPRPLRRRDGPVPVLVAPATLADVPVYLDGVGTARALNTVTVRPQVDGKLLSVDFKEGQDVKKGDVLAQIDPATYQAQLDQAVAKKALDEAQLANAKRDLERYEQLAATNAIDRQQVDTQRALVAQLEAQVQVRPGGDRQRAGAILDYTTIVAPIDGRTGIRMVDEGNIVRASDRPASSSSPRSSRSRSCSPCRSSSSPQVNDAFAKGALAGRGAATPTTTR